jgi:hypothetical protein
MAHLTTDKILIRADFISSIWSFVREGSQRHPGAAGFLPSVPSGSGVGAYCHYKNSLV